MINFKQRDRTVISLNDKEIKYLTLSRNNYGFYIKNFNSVELDSGIIVNGEILKIELLINLISSFVKNIKNKSIDLILPHEYFLFDLHKIKKEKKKQNKNIIKKYFKLNKDNLFWAETHSFEYDVVDIGKYLNVLVRLIPHEANLSYQHLFKKLGLKLNSIHSDLVSFSSLMKQEDNIEQIFIDDDYTYILEYENGIFTSDKKFNISYNSFLKIIKSELSISDIEANDILYRYGVLGTHKDKNVLKSINREIKPFLVFLKKDNLSKNKHTYIHFSSFPILGFSDEVRKYLNKEVSDLCVLCCSRYTFQDVLILPKRESYKYEPLIARALSFF